MKNSIDADGMLQTASFPARTALWTGISLVMMAVAAGIAYGGLHNGIFIAGDAGATAVNVAAAPVRLGIEIALWFIVAALDVIVGIGLYRVFAPYGKTVSKAAMAARLLYAAAFVVGAFLLFGAFEPDNALAASAKFEAVWYGGLILFGVHLLLLVPPAVKSPDFHWIVPVSLLVAGLAYSLIHALLLMGEPAAALGRQLQVILMIPMTLAELLLAAWLFFLGLARRSRRSRIPS
jgi:hypothetical protein